MTLDELLEKLVNSEYIYISHGVGQAPLYEGSVGDVWKIINTSIYTNVVSFASYVRIIGGITSSIIKIIVS